ncbi:ABC transporter ATP-binding protein [Tateyamaria sp. SN3-11]|uniref:ABC transporter ATP-binding protein n=1 Tax=Tateyamaria sp. SN3-11 TaxID=3092147 RepID=UPI0039E9FBE0
MPNLGIGGPGITVILGHNGSGKSTLLDLLARQSRPTSGTILFDGQPVSKLSQMQLARQIAYLPQRLPPAAGLTVRELVNLGRFAWRGAIGRWTEEDYDIVDTALHQTSTWSLADHMTDEISGGERQRAWIAMLLAQSAPILLLDEPTAALDLAHVNEVMGLLRQLADERAQRIIIVLHDVNVATRFADRIIALKAGQLMFDGAPEAFMAPSLLKDLYGVEMALLKDNNTGRRHAVVA